jgi:hypothetical protein
LRERCRRERENPREIEWKRDEAGKGRDPSTQVCDSGGQNQNPARQCDSGGDQADFRPIVEDPRVAGGPILVAVVRETREPVTHDP